MLNIDNIFYWGNMKIMQEMDGICKVAKVMVIKINSSSVLGHWVDDKINKYGYYRILKNYRWFKRRIKNEGKFFKPLKQTGGNLYKHIKMKCLILYQTQVEFEKQTGGAVVVPPNIVLKVGIIIKDEKKTTCFTVNVNNSNKIDDIVQDEKSKAIEKERGDAKAIIVKII